MELDFTTFALEVVNFLVLLWILTRFLYRPVKSALDARAQAAAQLGKDLASQRAALNARSLELDAQRKALEVRREAAERDLASEMAVLRQKLMKELNDELDAEREKTRVRTRQEAERARQQSDRELRQRAARFVGDYLKRLASPALEAAVLEIFLADLAEQSQEARAALRDSWAPGRTGAPAIDISTAYAPQAGQRGRVEAQVNGLVGAAAPIEWRIDPTLLAGICVHLPGYSLEASLRRGIGAFAAESA